MTTNTLFLQKSIQQKYFSSSVNNNKIIYVEPIRIYVNADKDKVNVFSDNRNKTGIYRWINSLNKNTHIVSSNNLSVRFYTYYSIGSLLKSNRPIDRALLKSGYSSFTLEILEYCDTDNLLKREQYYLHNLKP